jgi:hypothetical protein
MAMNAGFQQHGMAINAGFPQQGMAMNTGFSQQGMAMSAGFSQQGIGYQQQGMAPLGAAFPQQSMAMNAGFSQQMMAMGVNASQHSVPTPVGPSLGAAPDDVDALAERLNDAWDPKTRLMALDAKLRAYADRGGRTLALERMNKQGDPEMAILNKVIQDGQQQQNQQASEIATAKVLKDGMRDFIDYALDEVYSYTVADGKSKSIIGRFDWRGQGHHHDIPSLRRSMAENCVGDEALDRQIAASAALADSSILASTERQDEETRLPRGDAKDVRFSVI